MSWLFCYLHLKLPWMHLPWKSHVALQRQRREDSPSSVAATGHLQTRGRTLCPLSGCLSPLCCSFVSSVDKQLKLELDTKGSSWVGEKARGGICGIYRARALAFSPAPGTQVCVRESHVLPSQTTDCVLSQRDSNSVMHSPTSCAAKHLTPVSQAASHRASFYAGNCSSNSARLALLNFTVTTSSANRICILISILRLEWKNRLLV